MTMPESTKSPAEVLEARRLKVATGPKSYVGFSAPAGVTDAQAMAEALRVMERCEWGRARRIVSIDGGSGPKWASRVVLSYVEVWLSIAWRATFGRSATKRRIADLRASFALRQASIRGGEAS